MGVGKWWLIPVDKADGDGIFPTGKRIFHASCTYVRTRTGDTLDCLSSATERFAERYYTKWYVESTVDRPVDRSNLSAPVSTGAQETQICRLQELAQRFC